MLLKIQKMLQKRNTTNFSKCPICKRKITKQNHWVRFHITYNPEKVIMSCKWCNFTEFALRNNLTIPFLKRNDYSPNRPSRAEMVVNYLRKFDINYKLPI